MSSEWTGFWGTIAQVGATLLALAFVTFQVRINVWRRKPLKHLIAIFTLTELGGPVLLAVSSLMPHAPWDFASVLAGAAGLGLVVVYRQKVSEYRRDRRHFDPFDEKQIGLSWLSAATAAVLVLSGLAGLVGRFGLLGMVEPGKRDFLQEGGLYGLGLSIIWLLISGSFEAWYFLDVPKYSLDKDEVAG